jgi:hypothetical protein
MRAKVIRLIKETGIALPGIGLTNLTKIKVGQGIPPEHGGGMISDMEIDGQLMCIYKQNADGTPCRNFGRESDEKRTPLIADGVAFPVAMCKSFLFVKDQGPQQQGQGQKGK